jgi:hypothetical protein
VIDSVLVSGLKSGYQFTYASNTTYQGYSLIASAQNPGVTGQRYFYTDQFDVIRVNTSRAATSGDNPLS